MSFEIVQTVRPEITKEEFLRQLLIKLGTHKETPMDVVDAEFQEVQVSQREVILCTTYVEGDCNASIGYDRQEPYIAYENYQEKIGDKYVTKQRPVTKYKTVTDWHPFHTRFSGKATCVTCNNPADKGGNVELAMKTFNTGSAVVEGTAEVNKQSLAHVMSLCEIHVRAQEVSFPGDHHKDERYNTSRSLEHLSCCILPYYEVTYTYNGKSYKAGAYACGELSISAEYPPSDLNITELVEEKTQTQKAAEKSAWFIYGIAMVAAALLCLIRFTWVWPVAVALLILAMRSTKAYEQAYQDCSDTLSKDVMKAKVDELKAALEKHGYAPLSEAQSQTLDSHSVKGAEPPKSVGGGMKVLCWILTVALVIASFVVAGKNKHHARHVEVNVVEKTERYESDVSPYINGCYFIDLGYEIESDKLGIDYIEMKIHVFDEDGNELGYITSSLSDLGIEEDEPKVINTYLQENQPEKNAFFSAFYEAELEDLEFEVEIGSIRFEDGKYYHNDDYTHW